MDGKQLEAVLADLIQKMGNAAQQHGPEALDLVGQYLQVKAISDLAVGAFAAGGAMLAIRMIWAFMKSDKNYDDNWAAPE